MIFNKFTCINPRKVYVTVKTVYAAVIVFYAVSYAASRG